MNKRKNYGLFPLMVAIFAVIGSVAYIIYRDLSRKAYEEKWKEYDECGLG